MDKYVVGLDIGTTKIACFIGERSQNGKVRILGFGKTESVGVERGVVRNIRDASESIRRAVSEASDMAKYDVSEVYVGVAGQHIKSRPNIGSIMIPDDHRLIEESDVKKLIDDQYRVMLEPGEEIIHVFPQDYTVDNEKLDTEINPVGVAGKCLMANFHIVTGNASNVRNIRDAVESAGLTIKGVVLEPIASAYAVLSSIEKNAGVALVDIGGGTTDIAIFHEDIIRHTSVLALAGNVVTEDIRKSCQIQKYQAESLKTKFGSCAPKLVNQDEFISIPGIRNQPPREISVKSLAGIIKARMQLLFEQVQLEIHLSGYEHALIAGVVLTGGGARLQHIEELSGLTVGFDTRIGLPNEHLDQQGSVTFEDLSHPMYATGIGLVIYGLLEEEKEQHEHYKESLRDEKPLAAPKPTPEPADPEPAAPADSQPADEKPKHRKSEERKGFGSSVMNWLANKFSEPDLGE